MNEELKIIINAVTNTAQKNIKQVKGEIEKLSKSGKASSSKFGAALGAIGTAAKTALKVTTTAVAAVATALIALGKSTKEYQQEQAKLNTAFLAAGSSAEQAGKTYNDLYRFLGDSSKATEAANHLAKLTTNEKELAEWTTACQGIYATFGDSLPIEGLTEAANETAKVGTVTGTLADALNWAGVSEDAFNASLANCNSEAERQSLIRGTLNGLYSDAALIYEKNNAEMIAQNEAQAELNKTAAQLGKAVTPLLTTLSKVANVLLTALAPAIEIVSEVLIGLVDLLSSAVSWVITFIGVLSGSKKGADSAEDIASGMDAAASGAGNLTGNLNSATAAAEKLKRTTAGFDELNKVSSGSSSTGSSASGGSSADIGSVAIDTSGLDTAVDNSSVKIEAFITNIKTKFSELGMIFAPAVTAWQEALGSISISWENAKVSLSTGFEGIIGGFSSLGEYLLNEFIPNVVNSYSENLAPVFGDLFGFGLEQAAANFEFFGGLVDSVCKDIITPAFQSLEMIYTDVFEGIGAAWDEHGGAFLFELETAIDGIRETIETFYNECLKPIFDKAKQTLDEIWKECLKPLWDKVTQAVGNIATNLLILWNEVLKPVIDWILEKIYPVLVGIFSWIVERFKIVFAGITTVISGIVSVVDGLIQFIVGVFTADWEKAWEGVKKIFSGIFEAIGGIVKTPLNLIIHGINTLLNGIATAINTAIKAINKLSFTVPDWVPGIGGKQFGFNLSEITAPQIPELATGGIVNSATLAVVGEAGREAVLPLENNTEWMDKLADKIAARNAGPSKIVLTLDGKELGWANIHSINKITKQTGKLQLAVM